MKTKYYCIFFFICLSTIGSQAQDMIVNNDNDTIFCKIMDVNDETIRYRVQKGDIRTMNTMSRKYIAAYQINEDKSGREPMDVGIKEKESVFRITVGGGYARGVGKILKSNDAKFNQLIYDLVKGYNIETTIENYFNYKGKDALNFGAGLHLNYINHHAVGTDVVIPDFGHVNRYEESQITFYLAPAFVMRYDLANWLFTSSIGYGPVFFRNPMSADSYRITGSSISMGSHFGIEAGYKLSPSLGIGVKLSVAGGVVKSMKIAGETVKLKEPMSATSWMISGILSFRTK